MAWASIIIIVVVIIITKTEKQSTPLFSATESRGVLMEPIKNINMALL
jgi:hypothetical protein